MSSYSCTGGGKRSLHLWSVAIVALLFVASSVPLVVRAQRAEEADTEDEAKPVAEPGTATTTPAPTEEETEKATQWLTNGWQAIIPVSLTKGDFIGKIKEICPQLAVKEVSIESLAAYKNIFIGHVSMKALNEGVTSTEGNSGEEDSEIASDPAAAGTKLAAACLAAAQELGEEFVVMDKIADFVTKYDESQEVVSGYNGLSLWSQKQRDQAAYILAGNQVDSKLLDNAAWSAKGSMVSCFLVASSALFVSATAF